MNTTCRPVDRNALYAMILEEETSGCGTRARRETPVRNLNGVRYAVRVVAERIPAAHHSEH